MGWIENNPFYILGVSINDNRQAILQSAEERGLLVDADVCEAAATQLTNVKKRLTAEMRWFAGTPDDVVKDLVNSLTSETSSNLPKISLNPLSNYIYTLAVTEKQRSITSNRLMTLKKLIVELNQTYQVLCAEDILKDINDSRSAAGIPLIDSASAIDEEIIALRTDTRRILSDVLSALSERDLVSLITTISTSEIDKHGSDFGIILEDVINLYEIKIERTLNQTARNVYGSIDGLKRRLERIDKTQDIVLSKTGKEYIRNAKAFDRHVQSVSAKIDEIIWDVKEFDRYAKPLQLLSRAKGTYHELSTKVAFDLRGINIITMYNNYRDYELIKEAFKMNNALQEVFVELPAYAEQFSIDAKLMYQQSQSPHHIDTIQIENEFYVQNEAITINGRERILDSARHSIANGQEYFEFSGRLLLYNRGYFPFDARDIDEEFYVYGEVIAIDGKRHTFDIARHVVINGQEYVNDVFRSINSGNFLLLRRHEDHESPSSGEGNRGFS